jgi:hypothetical protein
MCTMPRYNKRATQIAYNILGVPPALRFKRSAKQEKMDKILLAQESSRVK